MPSGPLDEFELALLEVCEPHGVAIVIEHLHRDVAGGIVGLVLVDDHRHVPEPGWATDGLGAEKRTVGYV